MRVIQIKETKLQPIVQDKAILVPKGRTLFDTVFRSDNSLPDFMRTSELISSTIKDDSILHKNYLDYLKIAYNNDYGIVVSPNHIWFTILCSIADVVKNDPELFRKFFTENESGKESLGVLNSVLVKIH